MSNPDHSRNDLDSWISDNVSESSYDSSTTSQPRSPTPDRNPTSQIQHTLNFSTLPSSAYLSLAEEFSQPSFDSDDTCNSTISSSSVATNPAPVHHTSIPPIIPVPSNLPTLYHNPRVLGTMDYYYPRRIRQAPTIPGVLNTLQDTSASQPVAQHVTPFSDPVSNSRRFHQQTFDSVWDSFQSSADDVSNNMPWGDSIEVKLDHTVRLYFQNVNSLGLSKGRKKWQHILRSLNHTECDIIGLVQTSINWKHSHIRERFLETLRTKMPISKANVSRNTFQSDNSVLPGGVTQIVKGNWTGRIVEHLHDPRRMGRWTGFKIRLKHDRFLVVISAYRVCPPTTRGVETAYRQQEFLLSCEGLSYPDPRKQFIIDMTHYIKQIQTPMVDVILSLDANEALGESAHGLSKLMRECRLIDLFHHHHGTCPQFATYDGGSRRLDYMIGSCTLLPYVARCGYLEFYKGISTDHRGMFLDLSHELIDGLTLLERVPTRYLNSAHPKEVYKYKQYVMQEFRSHNILERASDLYILAGPTKTDDAVYKHSLNALDSLILQIQLKAEEKHCKKRTKFDWSDDIHYAKIIVNFWSISRKKITKNRDVSKICLDIYNSLPEEQQQYIDVARGGPSRCWLNSKKRLRTLMVHHKQLQDKAKQDIITNEASVRGTTPEKVAANHTRIAKDKRLYKSLRQHFHPTNHSGITHVLLPDKDVDGQPTDNVDLAETWRTETNPQEVVDKIYNRNLVHFGQAQGTPFTTDPITSVFGYTGMTYQGTSLVQDGVIPPRLESISQPALDIIHELKPINQHHIVYNDLITFEGFTKAIKKWREGTSTSPSGKHLGHYKSLLSIDSYASKYTDTDPDPGLQILEVLYHIAAAAFTSGVTLERWQHITTCMIEKLPGIPKINKLRVIHLYEADYNLMNKLIWQRGIVWEAHKNGTLNAAQAGSRPYHTSIEVVMSKDLKYMYSSLTKTPMATMDNDAKSCYDRIVASLALLISHKYGVPEQFCATVGDTLRQMQFSIRTAMGNSKDTYHHSDDTPIHGVGQGGTASPAFWLLVSSVLFNCYQSRATGMTMSDPTGTKTITQWLEALVDDTSLFTNQIQSQDIEQLVRAMEKDAQHWEQYLSASGGCLELTKCFYYVLSWHFDLNGDAVPMSKESVHDHTPAIHLSEFGKQTQTAIASKDPSEAHKTLGVWKTMTGDVTEQIKVLSQRSNNMANIIGTSGVHPYQADIALRMIYTPSMTYCLPAVNIPEKALDRIQNKALQSFIPALGFNHGFPKAILMGPTAYGGEAIPHLFTESKLAQLEILIMHIRTKTTLGQLLLINLDWIQITLGTSTPLFESTEEITVLQNWIISLQQFLRSINCTLSIADIYIPRPQRVHDVCIMDRLTRKSCSLSKNQHRIVNNWRLFFQVLTVSDLSNAAGDKIHDIYLKYPTDSSILTLRTDRKTKLSWPHQPLPESRSSFKLWTRCLRQCFLNSMGKQLKQPLGSWIVSPEQAHSSWQTYINPIHNALLISTTNGITLHTTVTASTIRTTTFEHTEFETLEDIPHDFVPVDVYDKSTGITAHHNKIKSMAPLPEVFQSAHDIDSAIQTSADWKKRLIQHYRIHDVDLLIHHIINSSKANPIIMVSDGGLKDAIGSFGVAIGTNHHELCCIEGPVSGNNSAFTSFRSEAFGMLAGIAFLHLFTVSYNIIVTNPITIYVYCDNLGVVSRVKQVIEGDHYPRLYLKSESDIILQLRYEIRALKALNIIIELEHIEGHQDDHLPYCSLSRPAQLNVDADTYATNYLQNGPQYPYASFPENAITIRLNNAIITRDLKWLIREASRSPALRKYMIEKYHWKDSTPDLIWWQIHGHSVQSFPRNDRRRIRKFIFSWLPTCERLKLYDDTATVSDECQSCKSAIETHNHLLRCPCSHRGRIKEPWYLKLKSFLSGDKYAPELMNQLLYNAIVFECTLMTPTTHTPPILPEISSFMQQAFNDQTAIGWSQIMRGRFAFKWGTIVATHLAHNKIPEKEMTALMWGRTVVKLIFQLIMDLWDCRNKIAHRVNDNNESILSRLRILAKIEALQLSNPQVRHCDHHFVYQPMETLETYSLCNLLSWHRQALSIIKRQKHYPHTQPDIRIALASGTGDTTNDPITTGTTSQIYLGLTLTTWYS